MSSDFVGWAQGRRVKVPVDYAASDSQADNAEHLLTDAVRLDGLPAELRDLVNKCVKAQSAELVWEAVTRFAIHLHEHKNPLLTLDALCFAGGLFVLDGKSQTDIAKAHGVTRQALSKRIVKVTEALGLPPARGMKSVEAREAYREVHLGRGKRKPVRHRIQSNRDNYLLLISKLCQFFNKRPIDLLSDKARSILKSQLQPLSDLHKRL